MKYPNIDVKTCYTENFDSTIKVDKLVKYTKERGGEYLIVTDEKMMYSHVEVITKARKNGLKPIIGLTLTVYYEKNMFKVIVYPKTRDAFNQIIKLSTQANLQETLTIQEVLKDLKEVALVFEFMGRDKKQQMIENVINLVDRKKVEPYIGLRINNDKNTKRAERLANSAKDLKVPLIAAQNIKHWKEDERLIEIIHVINDEELEKITSNSFKSDEEQEQLYKDYPEALQNTKKLADKCFTGYILRGDEGFKDINATFKIPENYETKSIAGKFDVFEKYPVQIDEERKRLISYLYDQIMENENIEKYIQKHGKEKVFNRIRYELGVIIAKGYENYFLVVQDSINYAKAKGKHKAEKIRVAIGPGRGSSGASFVAFLLNIVEETDPIEYDFMFERFLNIDVETHDPDIDIDISKKGRYKLFKYMQQCYGKNRVAKVATFNRYAGRMNIIDIGKALGIPRAVYESISKMIYDGIDDLKFKKDQIKRIAEGEPRVLELIKLAYEIDGLPKSQSIHAAGIVLSEKPIVEYLPIYPATDEETNEEIYIIQLDKDMLSEVGLNKIDFLGSKIVDVLGDAAEMIEKRTGRSFDLSKIPMNDAKTFELYQKGLLKGVFQMDSLDMTKTSKKLRPSKLTDIFHLIAIYRPGSMKMIDKYAENKMKNLNTVWSFREEKTDINGFSKNEIVYEEITEGKEILRPILEKTSGIILYQEQIMRILNSWAGFTPSEADVFRRAISHKEVEKMDSSQKEFLARSNELGRDPKASEAIFKLIRQFSSYGFNEPHAGMYGVTSYKTAYMKANHTAEYMASLYNSCIEETKKLNDYIKEAFKMGVKVNAPTVKNPTPYFTVVDEKEISYGIAIIRGLSPKVAKHIWEVHKKKAFVSFNDFIRRVDKELVRKSSIMPLIYSGFFDSFGTRKEIAELYKEINNEYRNYSGYMLLEELNGMESEYEEHEKLSGKEEFEKEFKDKKEEEATFYLFSNARNQKEDHLISNTNKAYSKHFNNLYFGKVTSVNVAKQKSTKEDMAFVSVNIGEVAEKELVIFSSQWSKYKDVFKLGDYVYVEVKQKQNDTKKDEKDILEKATLLDFRHVLDVQVKTLKEMENYCNVLMHQNYPKGFDQIVIRFEEVTKTIPVVMSKAIFNSVKELLKNNANLNLKKVQL